MSSRTPDLARPSPVLPKARTNVAATLCAALWLWAPGAFAADLVVSAASSLTNAFRAVAARYERRHPESKVVLNFGASDVLMQQIVQGAPADVFASADQQAMDKAASAGVIAPASRRDFASNALVLVVPADSTLDIGKAGDLARPAVRRVAYGNPASVPVGRYTRDALAATGLWDTVSAKGVPAQNVRQALAYVARGEVDAGFVFATDAATVPDAARVVARIATATPVTYPIAITARARNPAAASFVDFVLSAEAQAILAQHGFGKP
jgi:molybdate transport system substrate-binding protein